MRAYTLIDEADAPFVNRWRWSLHLSRSGLRYAVRSVVVDGRSRYRAMHRELMGLPSPSDGREVDHANGDGLDNRRANLRVTTHAGNQQNKKHGIGRTSRFRGVTRHKKGGWVAQATLNGRFYYLGYFHTEEEAAQAAAKWRAANMPMSVERQP